MRECLLLAYSVEKLGIFKAAQFQPKDNSFENLMQYSHTSQLDHPHWDIMTTW